MPLRQSKFMQILKVNPKKPTKAEIEKIVSVLNTKGLVVFPTQTVYAFGVDATSEEAIKKVYKIKGRESKKPMHVIVSDLEMAGRYVKINKVAKKLANKFLPGPLTLVLNKNNAMLPEILTSGLSTLGIWIPNSPLCLAVSKAFGKPYTTTSANRSDGPNSYSIKDVLEQLTPSKRKMISLVIDGGKLVNLQPTTLVDLTTNPPKILREGPITKSQLEEVLGTVGR